MTHWTARLEALGACREAITWARNYDTPQEAWDACENPGWMIWAAFEIGKRGSGLRHLAASAHDECARTFLFRFQLPDDKDLADIIRKHIPKAPL